MSLTDDHSLFLADFGGAVTLWPGDEAERDITAIWDEDYYAGRPSLDLGHPGPGPLLSGSQPTLTASPADLVGLAVGDALTVAAVARLGVAGGSFVVDDIRPDGTGMMLVFLREA